MQGKQKPRSRSARSMREADKLERMLPRELTCNTINQT